MRYSFQGGPISFAGEDICSHPASYCALSPFNDGRVLGLSEFAIISNLNTERLNTPN